MRWARKFIVVPIRVGQTLRKNFGILVVWWWSHPIAKIRSPPRRPTELFLCGGPPPTTSMPNFSKGLTHTYGPPNDDFLPSASAKYQITPNLDLKLGYNKAIKRPSLKDIARPDPRSTVPTPSFSIPNPNLTPEHAEKFDRAVRVLFRRPSSTISVNFFPDQHQRRDRHNHRDCRSSRLRRRPGLRQL